MSPAENLASVLSVKVAYSQKILFSGIINFLKFFIFSVHFFTKRKTNAKKNGMESQTTFEIFSSLQYHAGPSCSKLTMLLVNDPLKF